MPDAINTTTYPEYVSAHFQKFINFSQIHGVPASQISRKSTHNFLSWATNKQTNEQTNSGENRTVKTGGGNDDGDDDDYRYISTSSAIFLLSEPKLVEICLASERPKRSKTDRCGETCGRLRQTDVSQEQATRDSVHHSVSTTPTQKNSITIYRRTNVPHSRSHRPL